MSVIILDDAHLAALINWVIERGYEEVSVARYYWLGKPGEGADKLTYFWEEPDYIGQVLRDANAAAYRQRYGLDIQPRLYTHNQHGPVFGPVQILKACICYLYQVEGEWDGWEGSEAQAIIHHIRHEAICAVPGYEQALWEIDN